MTEIYSCAATRPRSISRTHCLNQQCYNAANDHIKVIFIPHPDTRHVHNNERYTPHFHSWTVQRNAHFDECCAEMQLHVYLFLFNYRKSSNLVFAYCTLEMAPSVSVNFISLATCCVRLREEEPQTAYSVSFTWAFHIAACVFTGLQTLPNQSFAYYN